MGGFYIEAGVGAKTSCVPVFIPWGVGSTLNINGGTVNLMANTGAPATSSAAAVANLIVNVSGDGAKLVLMAEQDLKGLNIPSGNAGRQALDVNTPSGAGVFRAVRIYAGDQAARDAAEVALYAALRNANQGGAPDPFDGIYDTGLVNHTNAKLGLTQKIDLHGESYVFIRATRIGDLNLDGAVTQSDWIDLSSHFNNTNGDATWDWGDLNYDSDVTFSDWADLSGNYNEVYV